MSKLKSWQKIGILLLILTPILKWASAQIPNINHGVFTKGIFSFFRNILDYTILRIPFPFLYVLLLLLLGICLRWIIKGTRIEKSHRISHWLFKPLASLGIILFSFFICWGFNYSNLPLKKKLGIELKSIDQDYLWKQANELTPKLNSLRSQISTPLVVTESSEQLIRKSLSEVLDRHNIPTPGKPRVKKLHPKGILLSLETAGFYLPFSFEGHIDAGLHPLTQPFVMAHEMGHVYGVTNEGECNLLAYLTCIEIEDSYMQYSGYLGYWRYLASELYRMDKSRYLELKQNLIPPINEDLKEIRTWHNKYPSIMPKARDAIYENYLKAQGIEEGLRSYAQLPLLVIGYEQKFGSNPN